MITIDLIVLFFLNWTFYHHCDDRMSLAAKSPQILFVLKPEVRVRQKEVQKLPNAMQERARQLFHETENLRANY